MFINLYKLVLIYEPGSNPEVWPLKFKLESSTFLWCSLCCTSWFQLFESLNEISKYNHSNQSYCAVLFCAAANSGIFFWKEKLEHLSNLWFGTPRCLPSIVLLANSTKFRWKKWNCYSPWNGDPWRFEKLWPSFPEFPGKCLDPPLLHSPNLLMYKMKIAQLFCESHLNTTLWVAV